MANRKIGRGIGQDRFPEYVEHVDNSVSVSVSVYAKLERGEYKNNKVFPHKNNVTQVVHDSAGTITEKQARDRLHKEYYDEEKRLEEQFKTDCFVELGLIEHHTFYDVTRHPISQYSGDVPNVIWKHPKADLLYSKAYEMGHSAGYHEVWNIMQDLVELIK